MTIELVKILEAAKEYENNSMYWFGLYEETNDELYWKICKEQSHKADAMLDAYEILTGKKIYMSQIKDELAQA